MATVAEIVSGALGLLRVLDATEAPEAEDMETAISALNMMMVRWEANGYSVGWSPVSSPADVMPNVPEADEAIMYNLAVKLRPRYGVSIDPDVFADASRLKSDVLADVFASSPMEMERGIPGWRCRYNIRSDGYRY
ncbi:packaged DNA stabilization gp4 family protein [Stenotrophomonas indicatrix]|uniref:packaged DNA stabilization gp4 family protein n=1 Tax=Stenotrophomonas indicatrix TaxID=2045451 RepID=UPI0008D58756|nr:packaged DNA stabilization gp4 family protein [Stenotrophomonas indicatrix]SET91307.1 P22 tail accessory factor [Stenotrophomonas indicatrix]SEU12759.1 P22 tail accessory factor [Stenotrophomonas indicatrix]